MSMPVSPGGFKISITNYTAALCYLQLRSAVGKSQGVTSFVVLKQDFLLALPAICGVWVLFRNNSVNVLYRSPKGEGSYVLAYFK